jgi:hypothetical protein
MQDAIRSQGVTVSVPFITAAPWMEQKYGNVPGVLNVIGDERAPAGTPVSANAAGDALDVTVCVIESVDFHCTMVPALTVIWTLVAPTNQSITIAPDADVADPVKPEPPHPDSTATAQARNVVRRRDTIARQQRRNAASPNSRTMSLALRST